MNSYLSADNVKKTRNLNGSTPEPAIQSCDTGQRIPYFDLEMSIAQNMDMQYLVAGSHTR